ncbi:ABC transporter ATP-binding protein [Helcococcus ovis]|uniref:ABC transporter ATP-binding protein n=1 Tax=Helcococcus ovis TaxID=72026 RepID=UPI0014318945|nr:ABC transporter ATP-binding protein [Helcococcus ovis]WNZ01696.1 ABC transporter ATP-binding protein [Helcococcus ovis]
MNNKNIEEKGSFIKEDYKQKAKFRNKKLLEYLLRLKGLFFVSMIFTVIAIFMELIGPYILGKLLDGELIEGIGARDINKFYLLVLLYFGTIVLAAIVSYFGSLAFSKLANRLAKNIRTDAFNHVLSLPVQFFDKYAIGKIVNRITNDTRDIRMLFNLIFAQILTTFVRTIGLIIALFFINWKLGMLSIIATPIIYFIFRDYFNKSTETEKNLKKYRSDLNGNLAETIQTMEVIQAFNKEDEIYNEFGKINDSINKQGWNLATLWAYSGFNGTNTLGNIIIAIAVVAFGYFFLKGESFITVGGLFVFIDYNRRVYQNINALMDQSGRLQSSKSAADQLFELMRVGSFEEGTEEIENMEGNIKFEDVSFAYNQGEYVIHNLDLDIPKGTSAAFVGHTGSGKSTVMNLIYKFYNINKGKIKIDGHDINKLNMEKIRNNMAIVFQNPYIFEGTVYENISLFDSSISKNDAELALISVGGEKILQRERGIDTTVRESGAGFSSGERQIISFARAMVRDPKILVLDEATANVDSETEELIQFGLNRLKKGRTTLIIAHRLSTIKDVDKIYLLEKGKLIESGSHDELIKLNGIYAQMYKNS